MTVQDICYALAERVNIDSDLVLDAVRKVPGIDLAAALTPEFLSDNVMRLFEILSKGGGNVGELTAVLEENAFMAAFQRACELRLRSRAERWANIMDQRTGTTLPDGLYWKQQRNIGVKVDDDLVTTLPL